MAQTKSRLMLRSTSVLALKGDLSRKMSLNAGRWFPFFSWLRFSSDSARGWHSQLVLLWPLESVSWQWPPWHLGAGPPQATQLLNVMADEWMLCFLSLHYSEPESNPVRSCQSQRGVCGRASAARWTGGRRVGLPGRENRRREWGAGAGTGHSRHLRLWLLCSAIPPDVWTYSSVPVISNHRRSPCAGPRRPLPPPSYSTQAKPLPSKTIEKMTKLRGYLSMSQYMGLKTNESEAFRKWGTPHTSRNRKQSFLVKLSCPLVVLYMRILTPNQIHLFSDSHFNWNNTTL